MKPRVVYYYRGQIERVRRGGGRYIWFDGYSETTAEGTVLYPWSTKTECRAEARERGAVATFERAPAPR